MRLVLVEGCFLCLRIIESWRFGIQGNGLL